MKGANWILDYTEFIFNGKIIKVPTYLFCHVCKSIAHPYDTFYALPVRWVTWWHTSSSIVLLALNELTGAIPATQTKRKMLF